MSLSPESTIDDMIIDRHTALQLLQK